MLNPSEPAQCLDMIIPCSLRDRDESMSGLRHVRCASRKGRSPLSCAFFSSIIRTLVLIPGLCPPSRLSLPVLPSSPHLHLWHRRVLALSHTVYHTGSSPLLLFSLRLLVSPRIITCRAIKPLRALSRFRSSSHSTLAVDDTICAAFRFEGRDVQIAPLGP